METQKLPHPNTVETPSLDGYEDIRIPCGGQILLVNPHRISSILWKATEVILNIQSKYHKEHGCYRFQELGFYFNEQDVMTFGVYDNETELYYEFSETSTDWTSKESFINI
jgi:hypothetical protein